MAPINQSQETCSSIFPLDLGMSCENNDHSVEKFMDELDKYFLII